MTDLTNNPFALPYDAPHGAIPFDRIKLEHYKPAILEGIAREKAETEQIANNPESPTFANTVLAMTYGDDLLERATTVLFNQLSAHTSDELEALAQELMPLLSEHEHWMSHHRGIFKRVKALYRQRKSLGLKPDEMKLLEDMYKASVQNGIGLPKRKAEQLKQLNMELSQKSLTFSHNALKDRNRYQFHITDPKELAGLPELHMAQAREAAKEAGKDGYLFTLDAPSFGPVLSYCDNRNLRRRIWMANSRVGNGRGKLSNVKLVTELVNLRLQVARTLGRKSVADLILERRMAHDTPTVMRFINELLDAYKPAAKQEQKVSEAFVKDLAGKDFKIKPWDGAYYSHKLQLAKFNYDQNLLRPYLELSRVIKGVFGLATTLYGITFEENRQIPVYHPDVKAYDVKDKDGSFLAVLYTDFHPRKSKKGGAWMTTYRDQYIDENGKNVRPLVSLVMNFTKPTAETPSLLTLGEVSTFLHEFGHGLHAIFSQCRFRSQASPNVAWDFVELPSQIMENFVTEKRFLHTFAFHHETGEPMPDELIDRVIESRNFGAATACLRQLSFCLLDMAYHTRTEPLDEDIVAFEHRAMRPAKLKVSPYKTCMSTTFGHIMTGGYTAGYYSYKWAEVLDADAFELFRRHGVLSPEVAERFRRELLSQGSMRPAKQLYRNYRGRSASIKALLRRDGIIK